MKEGAIPTGLVEIKRITRKYYEQLYINKLDNLDKMKKLSESHKLPKLSQEEIEMMNRPITSKDIGW